MTVTIDDVRAAAERQRGVAHRTPIMTSRTIDRMTGCRVLFKCENLQRVGAFKFRGAYNAVSLLSEEERARGVITHSSGNHAQALALAASLLGVRVTVVMPENSTPAKIAATREYGAEVILCEPTLEARETTTRRLIEEHGYVLIHPYDDERIVAGAGTAALELIEDAGPLDIIICPVGGGGLLSGTAIAAKSLLPDCTVLGAEPVNADDACRSLKSGEWVPSVNPQTLADGLRTSLGSVNFEIIKRNVDDIITVRETEIIEAMQLLWERMKLVVEPSGAVPVAALRTARNDLEGKRVGVILSGGNVDLSDFFGQMKERAKELDEMGRQ